MFVFWGMPEGLILTGSTFDEDCGQGTEDERLNAAAEPVEIQAGKGRDADLEQLNLTQEARQPAKDDVAQLASAQYSSVEMTVPDRMLPK